MKKNDVILILICLLAGTALFGGYRLLHRQNGEVVTVSVDGRVYQRFSLSQDTEAEIPGADGGTNHLVIENGTAYISDADCPDKLCVHQGAVSRDGESIVCLPHKVVVRISSKEEDSGIDAIAK